VEKMANALTPEQLVSWKMLLNVLFPFASRKRGAMVKANGRFVHYTSAESALKIIDSKHLWMRNTKCMSDFREVSHGLDALGRYFGGPGRRQAFDAALNACSAGIADETFSLFDKWWQTTQLETYITSISEHDDREDLHGRLSMWRAFGNATARVAIVIKINLAIGANQALGAELSPVGYFTDADLAREMDLVVSKIKENQPFLAGIDKTWLLNCVFMMLTSAVICLKHEGFHEEREWRVIHSPKRQPSKFIESSVEVVSGVPQRVHKIPFRSDPASGLTGLDPNELIDRIIIGPTQFPWAMYDAFVAALEAAGVTDPGARVFVSQIPVRT
jgi:hypothetical protein